MNLLVTTSHSLLRVDGASGAFEPVHRGLAFDVALDEVDAALVAGGDVADRDAAVDALGDQGAGAAVGELVAGELVRRAGGAHDRSSLGVVWVQWA